MAGDRSAAPSCRTGSRIWKLATFCYDSFWRRVWPANFGLDEGQPSAFWPQNKASSVNRRDLVLAILAAANGRSYTPVQIQKAVFVICDQLPHLIDDGPGFNFQPYDYGPFDSDVYSEIATLRHDGAAIIAPSGVGNWNTYAATDAGVDRGDEFLYQVMKEEDRAYIEQISNWVRSLNFATLVKSIYEAYPRMRANSIFKD
jgi:hypothetical protein